MQSMPPPYSAGPPGGGYAPAPMPMSGYAPAPPVLQQQSNTVSAWVCLIKLLGGTN